MKSGSEVGCKWEYPHRCMSMTSWRRQSTCVECKRHRCMVDNHALPVCCNRKWNKQYLLRNRGTPTEYTRIKQYGSRKLRPQPKSDGRTQLGLGAKCTVQQHKWVEQHGKWIHCTIRQCNRIKQYSPRICGTPVFNWRQQYGEWTASTLESENRKLKCRNWKGCRR